MSKIGRKPIALNGVKVEIKGQEVHYNGKHASGVYVIPADLAVHMQENTVALTIAKKTREINRIWGLHRALLSSKIEGAGTLFERQIYITGLGFKAISKGKVVEFSLGYTHKIDFNLPDGVTVEVDKTGQIVMVRSADKQAVGQVCGQFRLLRPTEPYKGTGVRLETDVVIRKAGKTKAGS